MPPGPRAPVLLQPLRYVRDPFGFLERSQARHAEGGSVTIEILGFGKTVWVTDTALVRAGRTPGTWRCELVLNGQHGAALNETDESGVQSFTTPAERSIA